MRAGVMADAVSADVVWFVRTVAALKSAARDGDVVYLLGMNALGDGTSGFYRWDASGSAPEDTSAMMAVLTSSVSQTGRWVRVASRVDGLLRRQIQTKRAPTPAIVAGVSLDVPVTWDTPFPNANYTVVPGVEGSALLGVSPVIKKDSRTPAGCVVTLKSSLLVTVLAGAGVLHLQAVSD